MAKKYKTVKILINIKSCVSYLPGYDLTGAKGRKDREDQGV